MSINPTAQNTQKLLDTKICSKLLVSERKNCTGTVLLIDQDSSGSLFEYHLLFSRAGFRTIKLKHPDFLFTLFATNEYDVDLIVSNTNFQVEWINCLAMIRENYNAKLNLQTTPIILYGKLTSRHFDFSFPNTHFTTKPSAESLLTTALNILKWRQLNQQE